MSICIPALYKLLSLMCYRLLKAICMVMGGHMVFPPREGKPFLGQPREPQLSVGKDGTTDPDKTCRYCKDSEHELGNCVHLQRKKDLQAHHQAGQGSN